MGQRKWFRQRVKMMEKTGEKKMSVCCYWPALAQHQANTICLMGQLTDCYYGNRHREIRTLHIHAGLTVRHNADLQQANETDMFNILFSDMPLLPS